MQTQKPLRLGIGILTGWIESAYSTHLVAGVAEVLRANGSRSVCFTLGKREPDSGTHLPFYELASPDSLGGIVVALSAAFAEPAKLLQSRRGEPLVCIGQRVRGVPSVWMHNAQGIRALFDHLVDRCGRQRIAFIRGPATNPEAEARHVAYQDMLAERFCADEPGLVESGDFSEPSGAAATVRLLERNRDARPDAIMAANDLMAIGAIRALKGRGLRVPDDIAVVGFDDLEAEGAEPPLTTVRQPVVELGRRAAELVLTQLRGESVEEQNLFPPELVIRRSCGNTGLAPVPAGALHPFGLFREDVEVDGPSQLNAIRDAVMAWPKRKPELERRLNDAIEEIEKKGRRRFANASRLGDALRHTRQQTLARLRRLCGRVTTRVALLDHIVEIVPGFGLDRFCLVAADMDTELPETAHALVAYEDGEVKLLDTKGVPFPARALLPPQAGFSPDTGTWLVLPVKADERWLGYAVLRGELYEVDVLADACNAIGGALARLSSMTIVGV